MRKFLLCILSCLLILPLCSAAQENVVTKRAMAKNIATASRAASLPTSMAKVLAATYDPQDGGVADYYMIFSSVSNSDWTKEDGPIVKDGFVLRLDCYAPQSQKPVSLASGSYKASSDYSSMTYDPDYSYLQYYDANGYGSTEYNIDGDITVDRDDSGLYTITLKVEGGQTVTYTGTMAFDDGTVTPSVYNQIKQNLDLTLNGALAFYDGNLYESNTGAIYINLYDHQFDPETGGMLEKGYSLALQVFGKLFSDSKTATLDPGTYTVARNFKRYTWFPGIEVDYMGMTVQMGCYAKERNEQRYNDGFGFSYLADGTIVIEDAGDGKFRITVDAVTTYGHTVKATFEGEVPVVDKSSDNKKSALSTLEDDVELNLDPIPVCRAFNGGVINGCQTFLVDIGSPAGRDDITEGDIMRMEFVLPGGTPRVAEGTYTVMDEKWETQYAPYKLGKGRFVGTTGGGTDLSGTRYMHFEEGRTLVMDHYAPADAGTIGVTKNADDTWTFDIHIIDDAEFRIDGTWTGPMELMYNPDSFAAISAVDADAENVTARWIDGENLILVGASDLSQAVVYNLQGMCVNAPASAEAISFAGLPSGVYIVKYKSTSIKIAKK